MQQGAAGQWNKEESEWGGEEGGRILRAVGQTHDSGLKLKWHSETRE